MLADADGLQQDREVGKNSGSGVCGVWGVCVCGGGGGKDKRENFPLMDNEVLCLITEGKQKVPPMDGSAGANRHS